ncbi:MAG: UDP-N-acetylmuramoyl-L-alanyl-D-glutamate--2,6-diaminopimelate ligase [Candidatus Latescibacteria bacterium]|nr:UDP-N-acetylmuramoyl-L-alanyl-D-glutamate--2,6-diaminopimelate ligase [Candidatus Latescibacterota bacterium]NIO28244.1 UDP-N-acetylmuramoyl-L-alanyl-D-glutamate--2,6-diaminopimelate ligase [Candidatus Latescibacterota bacterium]NIO55791.1 UDP-N-acetylmuramoyl-L-alanyl-D-glutamate--2,6-diaminopimelate ligase [Candidatus Latescibacterota bacterium]NIT01758.1 UDP-N-acetylmuramoyl-L-alanyl-D-glutamate--2,6-diaminopimelate ligase [Candidatus Latescibacterota bacterium]NIT38652.1 UDP-N-acetylmura
MKLSKLIEALEPTEIRNFKEVDILGISDDSRTVSRGWLFAAVKGTQSDGREFVGEAIERGAVACITEKPIEEENVANVVVEDSAKALALVASRFYENPADSLVVCGVTGTNGKTSTAHLLNSIAGSSSWGEMGIIGTIGHGTAQQLERAAHTTPEPVTLHRLLREMKDIGCRGVVMEVSSHAVRQQRTSGIDFSVGILTNVTRDHLDYHNSLEDYVAAKREFCESLAGPPRQKRSGTLVYSREDPTARVIGESFPGEKISVGVDRGADIIAAGIETSLRGTGFTLCMPDGSSFPVQMKLLGRFSVSNALLAAGAAHALGIMPLEIKHGLEVLDRVPGRFETLGGGERPLIVIDYCHTPDSVEMTLSFCRGLNPKRLITVFGCGGDRDRGKRPLMGRVVEELSDACYVTEDNPRTESLQQILEDTLSGMQQGSENLHVVADRSMAIQSAVGQAEEGEIVAIIGKGHEDYQIIGTKKHYFSDREEADRALREWSKR